MERKLYRYRSFKDDWKEEAFDGIVEPSSPLYFNDPYDCGFCFQEDILSELLGKEDYIKALEKYIPLKREDYDLILSSTDIESAVQIVFQNHGKKFPDSFFKSLRNDASECMDELKDAVRVVCLSETYDSMLMWSHYARNHTGYCIEYEFNKDDMYYSSLHQVRYTKDRFNISKKDILEGRKDIIDKTVCSKADVWSYVSAKYSCGFSNPQISPIIATDRYLDYFTTIMEDRLWQVLASPVFRWWNRSDLSMNAVRAA